MYNNIIISFVINVIIMIIGIISSIDWIKDDSAKINTPVLCNLFIMIFAPFLIVASGYNIICLIGSIL